METANYTRTELLVSATGITQRYGAIEVLSAASLEIRNLHVDGRVAGQVVALVGPSGVGKSVLMRIIAGLQAPTTGAVMICGERTQRGHSGFVFQRYPLFPHRSVLSNLEVAGRMAGLAAVRERAMEYLEMFRLVEHAAKFPAELSGGMQQRVAVAQQLISLDGPVTASRIRLLMLDEPFSALDYANTKKTCAMLRKVADLNDTNTLIVTTHDIRAALCLADLVVMMAFRNDAAGNRAGGYVARTWDLVAEGLTWSPEVDQMPRFAEIERELLGELVAQ